MSELPRPITLEQTKLEPVQGEPESSSTQSTEPLDLETVPFEPDSLERTSPERKKWTSKSKAHDTPNEAGLSTLEPVPVFETAASMLEVSGESSLEARKKWVPKVVQETSELEPAKLETAKLETAKLEPAAPAKTVLEIPQPHFSMRPVMRTTIEPGPLVKLDSREILEAMGIRLPAQNTSTVLPEVLPELEKPDSSESEEVEVPLSSGRKKWVPKRKL